MTSRDDEGGASRQEARRHSPGDGRNVHPDSGLLEGEAAGQAVPADRALSEGGPPVAVWPEVPSGDGEARADPTYYDRPVLKEPTWIWAVPAYFYAGGAAGAAAVLGAAAQAVDRRGLHGLVKRCRWIAATGSAVGTGLLIYDLGRPARFLNMLRVFRPSSPMNVGSWVLAGTVPMAAGSAVLSGAGGVLGVLGDAAGLGAGLGGLPLAGYTAVLLANTAVPVWQGTRRSGPPAFVSSAMTAAAGLLQLTGLSRREEEIVRRFAVVGAVAELAAGPALEREAGQVERVAGPLHEGASGAVLRAAKVLTAASLVLNLLRRRGRGLSAAAGALGTLGSLGLKWGLFQAGKASARDPRATFHQQRAGLGGAEVTGHPAVAASRVVNR